MSASEKIIILNVDDLEHTIKGHDAVVSGFGPRVPVSKADANPVLHWAQQQGIEGHALEDLAGAEPVVAAVRSAIESANARLARVEQIKNFTIVPGDWLPGGDELTPTMKLKRRPIEAKYAAEIDAMYA